jgi:dTMP kinase
MNDEAIHLMFAANRWEKKYATTQSKLTIRKQIIDTLSQGKTIVCSRYAYSGVAYSATKPGMDFEWCKGPDRGLPEPDTVIYLDVDIEEAAKRSNYGEERYEKRETQQKVKEQFERIISEDDCHVFQRVNANDPIDTVHKNVLARAEKAIEEAAKRAISKLWAI